MSVQDYDTGVESAAAFGELTYELTESLRATVGARYTHEEKFFRGIVPELSCVLCPPVRSRVAPMLERIPVTQVTPLCARSAIPVRTATFTTAFRSSSDETESFRKWTWRAALDWDVTERELPLRQLRDRLQVRRVLLLERLPGLPAGGARGLHAGFEEPAAGRSPAARRRGVPLALRRPADQHDHAGLAGRHQPRHPQRRQRHHERRRSRDRMARDRRHAAAAWTRSTSMPPTTISGTYVPGPRRRSPDAR